MKKRGFCFLAAFLLLVALAGCGQKASESPTLSGETPELSDVAESPAEALRRALSGDLLQPDEPVSVGEFLVALWTLAGQPNSPAGKENQLQTALDWAGENKLLDAAALDPDGLITRQEAMSALYAYHGGVGGVETMLTGVYDDAFTDSDEIPAGGKRSLYWGFYNVLIRETEPDKIAPFGTVSRGDMAAMLIRYMDDFQPQHQDKEELAQ